MPRVKRGVTARARHKKVLGQRGYRGRRKNVYRIAKQAVMKAGQYAYRDRRQRKRQFRSLWIARINAARGLGMPDSVFMNGLKKADRDRPQVLADLAVFDQPAFAALPSRPTKLAESAPELPFFSGRTRRPPPSDPEHPMICRAIPDNTPDRWQGRTARSTGNRPAEFPPGDARSEQARARFLGKAAALTELLKALASCRPEDPRRRHQRRQDRPSRRARPRAAARIALLPKPRSPPSRKALT